MVFGAISKEGKSDLWIQPKKESIDTKSYKEIVLKRVFPMAKTLYNYGLRYPKKWSY